MQLKVFNFWACTALFVAPACPKWTAHNNTNVDRGQQNAAWHLSDCQTACVNNPQCSGVDFIPRNPPGKRCWLSGPWSGGRHNDSRGIIHYNIDRNCSSKFDSMFTVKLTVE